MKLKLFGLTIFEIERDSSALSGSRQSFPDKPSPDVRPAVETTSAPRRPLPELQQSAAVLPRNHKGTIDVEASLRLLNIEDPKVLWKHRYKPGTAGTALKRVLGAQGLKPGHTGSGQQPPDLYNYPAADLPLVAETGKLDLQACLAMFDIPDPSVLWKKRFRPDSAGGRIKMCLRASGFAPDLAKHDLPPVSLQDRELPLASPEEKAQTQSICEETNHAAVKRDAKGNIDVQASLKGLEISDPTSLWRTPVQPGSAQHVLKKAIARALTRREHVPGITRADVGLTT